MAPFSLEHDTRFILPLLPAPTSTKVHVLKESVSLDARVHLDCWEVDPDWDGKMFKSAAQAKRPARSGDLPVEIKLKTGGNICIRCVAVNGKQYQLNI